MGPPSETGNGRPHKWSTQTAACCGSGSGTGTLNASGADAAASTTGPADKRDMAFPPAFDSIDNARGVARRSVV